MFGVPSQIAKLQLSLEKVSFFLKYCVQFYCVGHHVRYCRKPTNGQTLIGKLSLLFYTTIQNK